MSSKGVPPRLTRRYETHDLADLNRPSAIVVLTPVSQTDGIPTFQHSIHAHYAAGEPMQFRFKAGVM